MIDWQRVILDLRKTYSYREIDKRIGRHLDYAAKLARAEISEPKYSDGAKLLELHRDICK